MAAPIPLPNPFIHMVAPVAANLLPPPVVNPNETTAHERIWRNIGPVREDVAGVYARDARINYPGNQLIDINDATPIDFFLMAFPAAQWEKIVLNTNRRLQLLHLPVGLTVRELKKYLGIRLMMSLEHGHGAIDDYWATESNGGFTIPRNYSARTGMTLTRFKNISRGLCFHDISALSVCTSLLLLFYHLD